MLQGHNPDGSFATIPLELRFWEKVTKGTPDECWLWTGGTCSGVGLGTIKIKGHMRHAPQVSWELTHNQSFPAGMMACHTCDNPRCVNPAHIFPGTNSDNVQDSIRKGRWPLGEKHAGAKLTAQQVRDIRARYQEGVRGLQAALAREYRVDPHTIRDVIQHKTWTVVSTDA